MFEALVLTAAVALPAQETPVHKKGVEHSRPWLPAVKNKEKKQKKYQGDSLKHRSKRLGCKPNNRFRIENQWGFSNNAKLVGRCATYHFRKIDVVWTRYGHHPSASKALDIMTNTRGSCKIDRQTGDWLFKYLRMYWGQFGIRYIIWENRYYNSKTSPGRYMSRGGCTAGHWDHIHVAFW